MAKLRVLMVHNYYQQVGGEDLSFARDQALLENYGHTVITYTIHNDRIKTMNPVALAARTLWNMESYDQLRRILRRERPDVIHFHNTFPLISPSAYYAVAKEGAPVVQTLHNYRLACVNALLYRQGRVCEDCLGKSLPWPGVVHACYRSDRAASATVAGMLFSHRLLGTWARKVDRYIALSEFSRQKMITGGLPPEKIVVRANYIHPDPGEGDGSEGFALFVGRLAPEKGLDCLLSAWKNLSGDIPLKIVGDGPLAEKVGQVAAALPAVEWMGQLSHETTLQLVKKAACLVMPSLWYEGMPMTVIEAFAAGTPVIASRMGAMQEMVADGRNGYLFLPGDAAALAEAVARLCRGPGLQAQMRKAARQTYEHGYTAELGYLKLIEIYQQAAEAKGKQ